MSTDRELLKLAAKAYWAADEVSIRFDETEGGVLYIHSDNQDHNGCDREFLWNPRNDDGDALRLAVKLNMVLRIENYGTSARSGKNGRWHNFEAHLYGGINAATRRVIVRAAAEIGKAMP